jgi:hypothetical protein
VVSTVDDRTPLSLSRKMDTAGDVGTLDISVEQHSLRLCRQLVVKHAAGMGVVKHAPR